MLGNGPSECRGTLHTLNNTCTVWDGTAFTSAVLVLNPERESMLVLARIGREWGEHVSTWAYASSIFLRQHMVLTPLSGIHSLFTRDHKNFEHIKFAGDVEGRHSKTNVDDDVQDLASNGGPARVEERCLSHSI